MARIPEKERLNLFHLGVGLDDGDTSPISGVYRAPRARFAFAGSRPRRRADKSVKAEKQKRIDESPKEKFCTVCGDTIVRKDFSVNSQGEWAKLSKCAACSSAEKRGSDLHYCMWCREEIPRPDGLRGVEWGRRNVCGACKLGNVLARKGVKASYEMLQFCCAHFIGEQALLELIALTKEHLQPVAPLEFRLESDPETSDQSVELSVLLQGSPEEVRERYDNFVRARVGQITSGAIDKVIVLPCLVD